MSDLRDHGERPGLGSTNTALTGGHADASFFDPRLSGETFDLGLQFSYGADSCTPYWHVDEGGAPSDAGGGRTW